MNWGFQNKPIDLTTNVSVGQLTEHVLAQERKDLVYKDLRNGWSIYPDHVYYFNDGMYGEYRKFTKYYYGRIGRLKVAYLVPGQWHELDVSYFEKDWQRIETKTEENMQKFIEWLCK